MAAQPVVAEMDFPEEEEEEEQVGAEEEWTMKEIQMQSKKIHRFPVKINGTYLKKAS